MVRPSTHVSKAIIYTIGDISEKYALDSKGKLVDKSLMPRSKKVKSKSKGIPAQPQAVDEKDECIYFDSHDQNDEFLDLNYGSFDQNYDPLGLNEDLYGDDQSCLFEL